jgi:hypothetical protein
MIIHTKELDALFAHLDADGSGSLEWSEFENLVDLAHMSASDECEFEGDRGRGGTRTRGRRTWDKGGERQGERTWPSPRGVVGKRAPPPSREFAMQKQFPPMDLPPSISAAATLSSAKISARRRRARESKAAGARIGGGAIVGYDPRLSPSAKLARSSVHDGSLDVVFHSPPSPVREYRRRPSSDLFSSRYVKTSDNRKHQRILYIYIISHASTSLLFC